MTLEGELGLHHYSYLSSYSKRLSLLRSARACTNLLCWGTSQWGRFCLQRKWRPPAEVERPVTRRSLASVS
eukprot:scaffold538987_cov14-Prasinocladus_malaysianus.AAC.1